ncbi:MAG: histidine phosphatase family protein [Bdellovibrionales bacterium]|nr:histidine phosphatase family protein [Bdellovibrionales bacterium]
MFLILARHGNTFEAHEEPVWVGAKQDLPLTNTGREQALTLAKACQDNKIVPECIFTGPLLRTREAAQLVAETVSDFCGEIFVVEELREIDFGEWGGKTRESILSLFGEEDLLRWERDAQFPTTACWGESEKAHRENWHAFLKRVSDEAQDSSVKLAITSNGKLRLLLKELFSLPLAESETTREFSSKVSTGNTCCIEVNPTRTKIHYWNENPVEGLKQLARLLSQAR